MTQLKLCNLKDGDADFFQTIIFCNSWCSYYEDRNECMSVEKLVFDSLPCYASCVVYDMNIFCLFNPRDSQEKGRWRTLGLPLVPHTTPLVTYQSRKKIIKRLIQPFQILLCNGANFCIPPKSIPLDISFSVCNRWVVKSSKT